MRELNLDADQLVEKLLSLPKELNLCLLDSCGISYHNSHLLIAGISPLEAIEFNGTDTSQTLQEFESQMVRSGVAAIATFSYDFGVKLNKLTSRFANQGEPDIFAAFFDVLIIHDYSTGKTRLEGNEANFESVIDHLKAASLKYFEADTEEYIFESNFTKASYVSAVETIQEAIRSGETYQTNLTQQLSKTIPPGNPEAVFLRLRKLHPVPFAAFIRRKNDVIISASPERFLKIEGPRITTNPIKGTRPRGTTSDSDSALRNELLNSPKDRAENVMIVDLLRNDLGRICKFGSVKVEKLCDLEAHSTLFHLVSTVSGELRQNLSFSDVLKATFPCGSITGAPKLRTMEIIDRIEPSPRGLSMGAIGFFDFDKAIDLSVAIRTIVIGDDKAVFNVGGGIVIDSDPNNEYSESLTKAEALLDSVNSIQT